MNKELIERVRVRILGAIRVNGHRDIRLVVSAEMGHIQAVHPNMNVPLVVIIQPEGMIIIYPDGREKSYNTTEESDVRHLLRRVDSFFLRYGRETEPEV